MEKSIAGSPKDPGRAERRREGSEDEPPPEARKPAAAEALTGADRRRRPAPEDDLAAGVLTAGSFDDTREPVFFRKFLNKAGQNAIAGELAGKLRGQLLEVVVKAEDGRPVGGARVQVKPAAGGPDADLVTRTDGRAVFLSTWDGVPADGELRVTVTPPGGTQPTTARVQGGASRCSVTLPAARPELPKHLDLVLVLDTTGSMGDELSYLKREIKNIALTVRRQYSQVSQRYALVVYRDEGDEYLTRTFDFTPDIDTFCRNLSAQAADGGGDTPEAMHRALEDASKLQWREGNTARVLFLVADAPPHAPDVGHAMTMVDRLRKKGVAVYPVAASCNEPPAQEATELLMRAAALLTGSQYLFLTDDSGVGEGHGEPHAPGYHVEKLNKLMIRMIAGELAGKRIKPAPADVLRTAGNPIE